MGSLTGGSRPQRRVDPSSSRSDIAGGRDPPKTQRNKRRAEVFLSFLFFFFWHSWRKPTPKSHDRIARHWLLPRAIKYRYGDSFRSSFVLFCFFGFFFVVPRRRDPICCCISLRNPTKGRDWLAHWRLLIFFDFSAFLFLCSTAKRKGQETHEDKGNGVEFDERERLVFFF